MKRKLTAVALGAVIITAVAIGIYVAWAYVQPGVWLEGAVVITFEDGTSVSLGTARSEIEKLMLTGLKRGSVATYSGQKIWNINAYANLKFGITPADRSLKCQYYAIYWVEVEGTFSDGLRSYTSLWGFIDTFYSHYTSTEPMNRWNWMLNLGRWGDYEDFYQEKGSGMQIGALNVGAELAKGVCDAMSFNILTKELAERLTTVTTVTTKKDGDVDLLANWETGGPEFYTNLKRFNFYGVALHLGDFSIGGGRWARMWEGDSYKVSFKEFIVYRSQDITGEWTDWNSKTETIAALTMNIQEGYWYLLDVELGSSVDVS